MRRELHSKFRAPFSSEDEHFRSHQAENPLCAARQASTCACTFERVANEVDNNVSVIDTATNMVVATVPMGDDRGVAVTSGGKANLSPCGPWRRRRPWLEDAQRVGTPFPPRDLGLS